MIQKKEDGTEVPCLGSSFILHPSEGEDLSMSTDHPPRDVLLRFLRQELDEERQQAVDAHVGSCPACEGCLAQLAGGLPWPLDPVARLVGEPPLAASTAMPGPDRGDSSPASPIQ